MWSEISFVNIPDWKLTKLFTYILSVSEHEDAYMRVVFEITGESGSVCILLWKF